MPWAGKHAGRISVWAATAKGLTFPRLSGLQRMPASGADGIRTHDLRIANATLSQLSYGPGIIGIIPSFGEMRSPLQFLGQMGMMKSPSQGFPESMTDLWSPPEM